MRVRLVLLCLLAAGLIGGSIAVWSTTRRECQFHFASGACADAIPQWPGRFALVLLITGSGVLVVAAFISISRARIAVTDFLSSLAIVAQRTKADVSRRVRSFPARLFLGSLVAALAVAVAVTIFSVRDGPDGLHLRGDFKIFYYDQRPAWVAPLTVIVLIAGVGGGVAIAASGLRYRNKE